MEKEGKTARLSIEQVWLEEILSLDIFDAGAWLGKTPLFPLMEEGTPGMLEDIQQKHGITEALVSHWLAGSYTIEESNLFLLESIKKREKWHSVITGVPLFPGEPGFADIMEEPLYRGKIKGVRIYPETFWHSIAGWCTGPLCEILSAKKIPLFLFHTEASFNDIQALASSFPELDIVLETQVKKIIYSTRSLLPLMKHCPNIYTDISNLSAPGLLEYIIKNMGAERLVFSSFMPANDPMVPIGLLLKKEIREKDRKLIAGGNMRRLIAGITS